MSKHRECPVVKFDIWNGRPVAIKCELERHEDESHEGRGVQWTQPKKEKV